MAIKPQNVRLIFKPRTQLFHLLNSEKYLFETGFKSCLCGVKVHRKPGVLTDHRYWGIFAPDIYSKVRPHKLRLFCQTCIDRYFNRKGAEPMPTPEIFVVHEQSFDQNISPETPLETVRFYQYGHQHKINDDVLRTISRRNNGKAPGRLTVKHLKNIVFSDITPEQQTFIGPVWKRRLVILRFRAGIKSFVVDEDAYIPLQHRVQRNTDLHKETAPKVAPSRLEQNTTYPPAYATGVYDNGHISIDQHQEDLFDDLESAKDFADPKNFLDPNLGDLVIFKVEVVAVAKKEIVWEKV